MEARDLRKSFPTPGGEPIEILHGISCAMMPGRMTALVGPSGSGKSTALLCLAGLEPATSGRVSLMGRDFGGLPAARVAELYRDRVGFVFQAYNLVPYLTVRENITISDTLAGRRPDSARVWEVLAGLGLGSRADAVATTLSGGEQERVALGRIEVAQTPTTLLLTVVVVVAVAVLGAVGPARAAVRTPAVEAVRDAAPGGRRRMGVGRRILAGVWALACAGQLFVAFLAPPGRKVDGWPTGGGQAILASLLLAVLVVLLAPVLIPGLLRMWSAPLARLGGPWLIARRSALWRSASTASAIGLLALAISFTAALTTSLATEQAVVEAAHLSVAINQVDSLVLAAILGAMALLGAVAVVGMSSRSRQCEFAVLRCAGSTVRGVRRQVVVEAALYVGTALLISLVPLVVTTAGESLFYARAGMPLVARPGVGPVLLVALLSLLALVAVLLAPIRGATRTPIGTVLAAE